MKDETVNIDVLHVELLALHERYRPALAAWPDHSRKGKRKLRHSFVSSVSPALSQQLINISCKIPEKHKREYGAEVTDSVVELLLTTAIFTINPAERTPKACFNYLYTATLRAAPYFFKLLLKQRRLETMTVGLAESYDEEGNIEDFLESIDFSVMAGLAQKKRQGELDERNSSPDEKD